MNLSRRSFLTALSLAGIPTSAGLSLLSQAEAAGTSSATASVPQVQLGEAKPFSREGLLSYVRELADKNYQAPSKVPQDWINLTYDQYRAINFRPGNGLWHDTVRPFEVEFFAPGLYFPSPVAVHTVEDGMSRPVLFDKNLFVMGDNVPNLSNGEGLGFAGLRVRANINAPDHKDEFLVFQGASYFRGVAKDQIYGLSARGLALKTGDAEGEEFPEFREFWVETPQAGDAQIRIHALMDSPSVAGLYTFDAKPGDSTDMSVSASLFPRVPLSHAGIAAQTSMFLFDDTNRNRFDDFREGVHDSDGLLVRNGAGETLWRPLGNPRELQISSFVDENPRGFGLMQRPRRFEDYSDLEANYHKRPSLWVEPGEDWGKGAVTLVEIPADKEIYDNIVAYWRLANHSNQANSMTSATVWPGATKRRLPVN
ncbi:MAG: glucan biosynthesis protein G [Pseudomonadota bacterium]